MIPYFTSAKHSSEQFCWQKIWNHINKSKLFYLKYLDNQDIFQYLTKNLVKMKILQTIEISTPALTTCYFMLSYTYLVFHVVVSYHNVSLLFCVASYVMLHVFFMLKLVIFYLNTLYTSCVNAFCPNLIKFKNLDESEHLVFVVVRAEP